MRDRLQRLRIAHRVGLAEDELRRERQRGGALLPRLDAERARAALALTMLVRIDQRERQLAAASAAASVAANDSSDSSGRCRPIQSTAADGPPRASADAAQANGVMVSRQPRSTKVATRSARTGG